MKTIWLFGLITLAITMSGTEIWAQDWANLTKYANDNEQVLSENKSNRVVFMGNSITEAWVNMMPDFFEENNFIGRGISGQTTPQMLVRFRQDVINLQPQIVLILAGTNDIAGNTGPMTIDQTVENIISMAQLAMSNDIKVILCSVLPAFDYPWQPSLEPANKIIEINDKLKRYASSAGLTYLDYFTPMADARNGLKESFTYDGVHPDINGYQVMAPLASSAIKHVRKSK